MADREHIPEERESAAPEKQPDPDEAATPRLSPLQLDESVRRRARATAKKPLPTASEEEVARSREKGGPHPDVAPTEVAPPPTD